MKYLALSSRHFLYLFSLSSINSVKADLASLFLAIISLRTHALMNIKAQVIQFKGYRASIVQEIIFHEKPCFYIHQSPIKSSHSYITLIVHWFDLHRSPVN